MAILVNFAVLLPLFILLRADAEAGWPWPVVLIPVWLGDLLFGAAVVWRLVAAFKQHSASAGAGGGHLHLTLSHSLLAALVYLLLLTSQILLAMRLEGTKAEHAVSFSVALLPFYVALLPNAATALVSLLTACYRRVRHSSGDSSEQPPPPSLNQLLPSAYALAGRLLLAASLCLAALEGDGVLDISWWLVLLPMWVQVGLLVAQWHAMLKGALGAQGMAEEERAAKIGASVLLGVVGLLGGACFLLLSLKVGGQADYAAWVIASPLFGALALACCCLSCLACIANAAAAAQRNYSNGHPPYDQVGPDVESAAQSMEAEAASDGGGVSSSGGGSSSGGSSSSGGGSSSGRGRDGTSTSAACDSAPPSSASDTAAAMEEGGGVRSARPAWTAPPPPPTTAPDLKIPLCAAGDGLGGSESEAAARPAASARCATPSAASEVPPHGSQSAREASSSRQWMGSDQGGGEASAAAAAAAAGGGGAEEAQATAERRSELEGMSTKQLKAALSERGVPHEHCLEKRELLELLLAQGA